MVESSEVKSADGPVPEITASEAVGLVREGTPLIDVREQKEWDSGHAPDAHLIPLAELGSRLSELPRDRRILVICHSGMRSERATRSLIAGGFDAVTVAGGMLAWASSGGEVETGSQP